MNRLRGLTAIADRSGRLPRRTVRLRLTGLYADLFLLSGAALLAITYLLVDHATGGCGSGPQGGATSVICTHASARGSSRAGPTALEGRVGGSASPASPAAAAIPGGPAAGRGQIAEAHGATLIARPRPGGGLRVEVAFPVPGAFTAPGTARALQHARCRRF